MLSRNDRNPTPRSSNLVTVSIRCRSDRPNRSNRPTTSVSPGRNCPKTSSSCGRRSQYPRRLIGPHPEAPHRGQLIDLQVRVLLRGRHPRVPQQMPHQHNVPITS